MIREDPRGGRHGRQGCITPACHAAGDCGLRVSPPHLCPELRIGDPLETVIFTLGEPDGSESARVRVLADLFEAAAMGAPVTTDIRHAIWAKLLINASRSPLGVLTGATERGLAENPETLALTLAIMREAQAVARSHGIEVAIDEVAQSDPDQRSAHRSSMLQDWDLGRPMEIDGIVRIIQDFARAGGLATPALDAVAALIGEKARVASA